jgi:hypothetical protein
MLSSLKWPRPDSAFRAEEKLDVSRSNIVEIV